jgi:SPP1 gp7 family putative phage head morphogenesis protein
MARYRALRAQVDDELRRYSAYMESRIVDGQRAMAAAALEHSAAMIDTAAAEAQVAVPFVKLPRRVVDEMIGMAGNGTPLRSVLEDASRGAGDALGEVLVRGVALGKGPLAVAQEAIRLGLGRSFTRMQAIARSESLRAYRSATLAQYESSRVISSYTRLSARDSRTCAGCLFADGRTYPVGYGFDSHVNCRCTLIPNLRNVPPTVYETGPEWFRAQPAATQKTILGPTRYSLWNSGKASLDDMVTRKWDDVWGGSLIPTRVQDLPGLGG